MTDFQTSQIFYNVCFFQAPVLMKRLEKNILNEIWAQFFFIDLHVYMAKGYD